MLHSTAHGHSNAHKYYKAEKYILFAFKLSDDVSIMLIHIKVPIVGISTFVSMINSVHANNCWHFNIYEHDIFRAQLSLA